jgi:hypothetical protein
LDDLIRWQFLSHRVDFYSVHRHHPLSHFLGVTVRKEKWNFFAVTMKMHVR